MPKPLPKLSEELQSLAKIALGNDARAALEQAAAIVRATETRDRSIKAAGNQ